MSLRPLRLALFFAVATAALPAASVLPAGPAELARLRDAAERGDRAARHSLGLVYADPAEPAYNPVEAYVWLTLAATGGTESKTLENLRASLTPAQLAAAQRLLATRDRTDPALAASSPAATSVAVAPEENPARLRAQLTAAELENERLRTQIAEQKMRLTLREEDLAALGRQLAATTPDKAPRPAPSATPADKPAAPDPDAARLRAERDRLQGQLAAAEAGRAAFQRQLDQAAAGLAEARRELAARRDDPAAKALATERDTLKERTAALQTQVDQFTARLAASEQTRADLSRQLAASESARAETARQSAAAAEATTTAAAQLATLQQQLADTETKLAASVRAFNLREEEIARLQKALVSLDEERAAAATRLATTEAARADLVRQLATATEALAQANAAPRPDPEAEALRARLADATRADAARAAALAAARENLAVQQEQLASLSAAHERELETMRTQLREARTAQPAAVAAPNLSPAEAVAPRVHTVAAGDTLGKIARQYYGTASRWPEILEANRDRIKNPDILPLGARLDIP